MSAKATASVLSPPARSFTPAPANLLQRQCACGGSIGLSGKCETCQQKALTGPQPPLIQPKLKISQPNDPYEQEADRVAEQVMRMPEPMVQRTDATSKQDQDNENKDKEGLVQRKVADPAPASSHTASHPFVGNLGSGKPLDAGTRSFFEPRFGHDLSHVRVHADTLGAESAESIKARAYTLGRDVVFGDGQYTPATSHGQRLLAHELVHVVQQTATDSSRSAPVSASREGERLMDTQAWPLKSATPVVQNRIAPILARLPESLDATLDIPDMTDEAIRAELREIIVWMSGQTESSAQSISVEAAQAKLEAELKRRHEERIRNAKKPKRRGKQRQPDHMSAETAMHLPRAATTDISFEELTPEEQAEELQLIDEFLAVGPKDSLQRQQVRATRSALTGHLSRQNSAPLSETHRFVLGKIVGVRVKYSSVGPFNHFEAITRLRRHIDEGRAATKRANEGINLIYRQQSEHDIISLVGETFSGAPNAIELNEELSDELFRSRNLLSDADNALNNENFRDVVRLVNDAIMLSVSVERRVVGYFDDTVVGAERAVTGAEVVKIGTAAGITIGTGGLAGVAVGALYSGTQAVAQQASEVHYGLRDEIDWSGVTFDMVVGAITGYLGGRLGNKMLKLLMANPAAASLGKRVLTYAITDFLSGRLGSSVHFTARMIFDSLRDEKKKVTWGQYLDALANQWTDPKQAIFDVILGHANRRVAAQIGNRRTKVEDAGPTAASKTVSQVNEGIVGSERSSPSTTAPKTPSGASPAPRPGSRASNKAARALGKALEGTAEAVPASRVPIGSGSANRPTPAVMGQREPGLPTSTPRPTEFPPGSEVQIRVAAAGGTHSASNKPPTTVTPPNPGKKVGGQTPAAGSGTRNPPRSSNSDGKRREGKPDEQLARLARSRASAAKQRALEPLKDQASSKDAKKRDHKALKQLENKAASRSAEYLNKESGVIKVSRPTLPGDKRLLKNQAFANPEQVRNHLSDIGHQPTAAGPLDQVSRGGYPGRWYSLHAESQQMVLNRGKSIGVDLAMCQDCIRKFQRQAIAEKIPQVVSDPNGTWVFSPDGTATRHIGGGIWIPHP